MKPLKAIEKFIENNKLKLFWLAMAILCCFLSIQKAWIELAVAIISLAIILFLIILDHFRHPEIYKNQKR